MQLRAGTGGSLSLRAAAFNHIALPPTSVLVIAAIRFVCLCYYLESLGFAQNFLSSCESEALHLIGIRSFGEEFREDVVFRGIQEKFRKPLA